MKNKKYTIMITCFVLLISGISYSCSFRRDRDRIDSPVSIVLSEDETAGESKLSPPEVLLEERDTGPDMELSDKSFYESSWEPDIYVHLCGAVHHSDVYRVKKETRLVELIQLAGGLTEDAAGEYINQAAPVRDGQRIYIPTIEEWEQSADPSQWVIQEDSEKDISNSSTNSAAGADGRININRADASLLMTLPGIGEARAESILEYRRTKGDFKTIEQLMEVQGIKEGMFQKLSSLICTD